MYARVYPRQEPTHVVQLATWQPHDDFYPFAPGTKPKGLMWCPADATSPFLLPRHLYMFKTGDDWRARQFWSEVIAYELSKLCGVYVPPAFIAIGPDGRTAGCLLESFFGYPDQEGEARLIHGADLLRRVTPNFDEKSGRPHTMATNVRICRSLHLASVVENWAAALAFDALLGNTDRHPENWGVLRYLDGGQPHFAMAPLYDNGTSLGYNVQEENLFRESAEPRLTRFVSRGTHHVQLRAADRRGGGHAEMCRAFCDEHPGAEATMRRVLDIRMADVDLILDWCQGFNVQPHFSQQRAAFVRQLLESRRTAIIAALEG